MTSEMLAVLFRQPHAVMLLFFKLWALLNRMLKPLRGCPQPCCLVAVSCTDEEKVLHSTPKANGETATGSVCM